MIIVVPSCLKDADGARTRSDQNMQNSGLRLSDTVCTAPLGPIYNYLQIHVTYHELAATTVFHACALLPTDACSCLYLLVAEWAHSCPTMETFFHVMAMCGVLSRLLNNKHVCRRILLYITEVSDGNILFINKNWFYIPKLSPISNSSWSYYHLARLLTSIVKLPTTIWAGN